ncbi:hypothetical protein BBBOND_0300700 [Babesia bigemina]|uniref:C3H1-type domain-containing protein n=1 Tax=Babesia bigemina TaxID=5866 RepID=A0A061DDC9_BABBI|nr:hypothetical protein BBBOND_0300700 [Babesia bigemina]CDR96165.1 hypothetical protein BBBOND_0300700 [Babesia bigemina]|eukprot:XP_012768351.1 hypothetical protein BBBOND_0300700 [Babesia bigemina]
MAPKKLTDCPENLREAIDWLIQVRHGNDNGLDHLSKAVKKLIDEAIEKAYTTNVSALLKALDSAKSYKCCKDKVAQIEKLKELKSFENGPFNDLKTRCEIIKNCTKRHLDSSQQKAYEEIQSKLEQLKSLKESLTGLTDEEECKKLLTNLCDGVETFLGFDSNSKGYTGQGIVYSDLDRLCDAAMAFLHGVLGSVKDDNAVTTYDNYILDESKRLNKVLEKLQSQIGKGSAGLVESVTQVTEWLEGYEREVKLKSDKEKDLIINLENQVEEHKKFIEQEKDKGLTTQMEYWTKRAGWYLEKVSKANKVLESFDSKLRDKLRRPIDMLLQAVKRFQEEAANGDVQEISKLTDKKLSTLKEYLGDRFNARIQGIKTYLKRHIGDLHKRLMKLNAESLGLLKNAINDDLQEAFNTVQRLIRRIIGKYQSNIVEQIKAILNEAEALTSEIRIEKQKLNEAVSGLEDRMGKLKGLKNAMMVPNNLDEYDKSDDKNKWNLQTLIKALKEEINRKLASAIEDLWTDLQQGLLKAYGISGVANPELPGLQALLGSELKKLQNVGVWIHAGTVDKHDIGNHLEEVLINLKRASSNWAKIQPGKVGLEMLTAIINDIGSKTVEGGKIQLGALCNAAAISGVTHLQDEVTKVVDGPLTDNKTPLTQIKNALVSLQTKDELRLDTSANGGHSEVHKKSKDIHDKIQNFLTYNVGESDVVEGSVYKDLKELQESIDALGVKVINVGEKVSVVSNELTSCIKDSNQLLRVVPKATEILINKLRDELNENISESFYELRQQAEDLYTRRKQKEVAALKKSVKDQFTEIDKIMEADSILSVKGFLKILKQTIVSEVLNIKCSTRSTLDEGAKILNIGFASFFKELQRQGDLLILNSRIFMPLSDKLETLLNTLTYYNHSFRINLDNVRTDLTTINFSLYYSSAKTISTVIKRGLSEFAEQLGHAYVSRYSGKQFNGALLKDKDVKSGEKQTTPPEKELTPEGRNCAKVCLTIVKMVYCDLGRLTRKCKKDWKIFQIHRGAQKVKSEIPNPLGHFLERCGYRVSDSAASQNGHLRNQKDFTGQKVYDCLASNDYEHVYNTDEDFEYPLQKLYHCLQNYYVVGHYASSFAKKQPCSVFEMLCWMCGLQYNSVQSDLLHSISEMLEEPATPVGGDGDLVTFDLQSFYINTYPNKATCKQLDEVINHIMSKSASILTTVLGYGDEHTTYACDFYDNSLKLYYPKSGEECLDMLLDILRRMFAPLRFLFMQCRLDQSHYGWADCYYGKQVYPLNWQCKDHEAEEANCRLRSALQSYLSDCLVGCMPHQLSAIGCKATCITCPKGQPGMACLTPLGFRGFSGSNRKGEDISNVLGNLFSNPLVASLFALAPKAPSTLPEHYQFALSLVNDWRNPRSHPIEDGITAAIDDRSISLYDNPSQLTNALRHAYGSSQASHDVDKHPKPIGAGQTEDKKYGDLCSLAMSIACSDQNSQCAPYLYALFADQYTYLASKQCKTYLSWAVYLPWTLWNYLNSLYNSFKDIYCQDWGCRSCLRADRCRRGQHGLVNDKTKAPNCHCSSIVECKGAMPTLYKYGFTFGAPAALNGQSGKKTCSNFMEQLNNVLQSTYFQTLFRECDNFLWKIREPFTWTVVALWLLSLLYLLHIMVIRLDLLHIKSHLHSPSSHRIAAQSLLAAARVGRLAKISYLQA